MIRLPQIKRNNHMMPQIGKVLTAAIYTCKDRDIPSRSNETEDTPKLIFKNENQGFVKNAFSAFVSCSERCKLVLLLDNGQEISFVPTLQKNYPAFGEPGHNPDSPAMWNIQIEYR